jgi:glycosyltransferase involved in cell wall biosynthesis
MAKHILYLTYDGITDPLGSSQVLPYILGLEALGYRFSIISFEKPDRFADGEAAIREILKGKNIRWIPVVYHKSPPVLSTLWDVKLLKGEMQKLHKTDPFHLMHCRSYITSLAGLSFKKKYDIPFVFDMRAFYPDERADAGLWPKNHPLFGRVYRFFKKKEAEFLGHADHTVVLTEAGANIMRQGQLTGTPFQGKLSVIPCCADMAHFNYGNIRKSDKTNIRKKLNITPETFVLGYSGSVGTWYMLPEMLDFFKVLLEKKPDSLFLVLSRDNAQEITDVANAKGISLDKIKTIPVSRAEMPVWLSIFDYSIFFILPTFSKQASSPTKQGELMGLGIPVICNANVGDTEEIVEKSSAGIVVKSFTENDYALAAEKCILSTADQKQIRDLGISYYGLTDGINRYNKIYTSLLRD